MPKNHDKENMDMKIWMNTESQERHVRMKDFHHGNPGLRALTFLAGYSFSNGSVGGHT